MLTDLKGKRIIVTGASKGIGLSISEEFAAVGSKVLMIARNADTLNSKVQSIKNMGGNVSGLASDVSSADFLDFLKIEVSKFLGGVDIIVMNAGGPPMGNVLDQPIDVWEATINSHLMNVIKLSKEFLPEMKAQAFGRLIYISSTQAFEPTPEMVVSATVRAGVSAFMKSIAGQFAPFGITSNVICPGGVQTERLTNLIKSRADKEQRSFEEVLKESEASIPSKRFADPKEISGLVSFLCSSKGSYITGQSLIIDGGLTKGY